MKKLLSVLFLLSFIPTSVFAQNVTVGGKVVSVAGNEPLPGVNVVVKGNAAIGTITDLDGRWTLSVPKGSTLSVSFIGYRTEDVAVKEGVSVYDVSLHEDSKALDEVVVVGYGVQKKSVVTASIAKVSGEDLSGRTRLRADDALKGMAAGVNVTSSSGQPGSKSMIRIRGIGTINNSEPLYIIDGMPTDQNGMESVNPGDIESMEILKDAASGAIYGARAANGVILVTTKKGKAGKAQINYNFSYGLQSAWRHRDVTGAADYAVLMNEKYINGKQSLPAEMANLADPFHITDANGDKVTGFGTDWQKALFNDNAPITQHDVSVSGAGEKVNYYFSLGYFTQDGIVGGNYGRSNYDRLTLRSNNTFTLIDASGERNFLNKLDFGANLSYMRVHNTEIEANSTWGSPLGSALYLAPTLPIVLRGRIAQDMINRYSAYELYRDADGNPYTVPGFLGSYNEQNNPIAMMQGNPTKNWAHKFMPKFSLDLQLWDNLKYHFSWSAEQSFFGNSGARIHKWYLSGNNTNDYTEASVYKGNNTTWQIENTLTYDKTFGKHAFGVVLGQSALRFYGDRVTASHRNLININKPYPDYTGGGNFETEVDAKGNIVGVKSLVGVSGSPYVEHRLSSLFGRFGYNYDERYMIQATVRRDGSSRFGASNKYGTFPSVSLGWNAGNEAFMEKTRDWLSNFKVRFSWGKNGNDNIGDFTYTTNTTVGNSSNYYFGSTASLVYGSKANRLDNPQLKWEESEQTDFGLDFGFFNNALTFTADYFVKRTNGMIIEMPIPSYVGELRPLANVGDMENSGFEFELGYKWHVDDARFAVRGNASYLHNELKNLGNDTGFLNWSIERFSDGGTRAENGQPFPFFYGYKTLGVFQNMDQVNADTRTDPATGTTKLIQPDAQPGDLIFYDRDGNGEITSNDRTNIGNGTPKWTFGLNLNADWKGFDLGLLLQGVSGVDVFDATYRQDIASGNFPTWVLSRWTGEGTSDRVPILKMGDSKNWVVSDLYIQDGSYLRLKNITLGYTLPRNLTQKAGVNRFRLFVMAENLFTWTKYWGFDPEIGSGSTSLGVDYGVYPQARTWTVGFNISL